MGRGALYQVGSFGPNKWKEWNGQFRDDIRAFIKGDPGTVVKLRERITGSLDLYGVGARPTGQSINFVTCHDDFTSNDLVSYNAKHNEANGERNRDGTNSSHSWNCGMEGATSDGEVNSLRTGQIKNLLALTLISAGTPMVLMGDECRRTQGGNNNSYCQNNETSWFDWDLCDANRSLIRFVERLVHLRLGTEGFRASERMTLVQFIAQANFQWHGTSVGQPDWRADSHSIAFTTRNADATRICFVAVNSYWQSLSFELPLGGISGWHRIVDTFLPSPDDIAEEGSEMPVTGSTYIVNPRSLVILTALSPNRAVF